MAWGGFKAPRMGPPKPKTGAALVRQRDLQLATKQLRSIVSFPQQAHWEWHSSTQLWVDVPAMVLSPKSLPRDPSAAGSYVSLCRKATRAACLSAFDRNGFKKQERAAKPGKRAKVVDRYTDAIDLLSHVGLVRLTPTWTLEKDSLLQALHGHRDGAFDIAGYSVSATGNVTWQGQYLDADNREGSIGIVYNEIDAPEAGLRVVYEFQVAMI